MRAILTRLAMAGASLALVACNGIGDGNTLNKLEIVPAFTGTQADKFEQGGTYRLYQCLRDELLVQGTFDSGVVSNFNTRATWTSSNENVVRVSNRNIPAVFVTNGQFTEFESQPYTGGTLIPQPTAVVGDTATITATFAGLSASINVIIRKPELRLVPVPHPSTVDPFTYAGPAYVGVRTSQRLAMIGKFDGRVSADVGGGVINAVLNPILWTFPAGEYRPLDDDAATTFDNFWVIPGAQPEEPYATLNTGGTVRGLIAGPVTYDVRGSLSLCPDATDPTLRPETTVRVLPFDTTTPITLSREPGLHDNGEFTPPAQFTDAQLVAGTNQILSVVGHLDSDGDNIGDVEQNLSAQVRFNFEPKDSSCDSKGLNCLASTLFTTLGSTLSAVSAASGRLEDGFDLICLTDPANPECDEDADPSDLDPVMLEACFPLCATRLVSLAMDPPAGFSVTLTATPFNLSGAPRYVFSCGDGSGPQDQGATNTLSCDYTGKTGPFTPTVRVLDNDAAISANAGAVQVNFDPVPTGNTAPTVQLSASPASGTGPVQVFLTATASDANSGDAVTYFQFEPDDGIIIRQSSQLLSWIYQAQPASGFPKVTVYDKYNVGSTVATVTLTIAGSGGPAPVRSAALPFEAVRATPCEIRLSPPAAAAVTEVAHTFPGAIFRGVASFVAATTDAAGDCSIDPVIGTQDVSRYLTWNARPAADSTEFSDFVTIRSLGSDFQRAGQVFYLDNVDSDSTAAVVAPPDSLSFLKDVAAPVASSITVQPCPGGTCPPN